MPRQPRLDAPGVLQHVICRGIERQMIVRDTVDRARFVERLGAVLLATGTRCYAWALLPNHVHLLLRTGSVPLHVVMRRLLTGYASDFNRRHRRHGYVFQNRYKSILCQEEPYLLELVRYIHLNPLRAQQVPDLQALNAYPWSGHSALLGTAPRPWQATGEVLAGFGPTLRAARRAYRAFLAAGIPLGWRPELTGGGLVRSAGGWHALAQLRRAGERRMGDTRILGDGRFVEGTLREAEENLERRTRLRSRGVDLPMLIRRVAHLCHLSAGSLYGSVKIPQLVRARSLVCWWATRDLGCTAQLVARTLGLTQPAVSKAAARGEHLISEGRLRFPV
jgi:REP element-mobilizing transposase RayT